MDELPAKLEDLFHFSFNFDNLIKIISFLNKKNQQMSEEIKELTHQMSSVDDMKQQISDLQIKAKSQEKNLKDQSDSLSNHQTKLMEIDAKIKVVAQENVDVSNKVSQFEFKVSSHEENLNNLNRVVEDHIKSSKEQEQKIQEMDTNVLQFGIKADKLEKDFKDYQSQQSEQLIKLQKGIDSNSADIFDVKGNIEKKNNEIDKTITNLITNMSDISAKVNNSEGGSPVSGMTGGKTKRKSVVDDQGSSNIGGNGMKLAMEEIEKLRNKIQDMSRINLEQKEQYDKDIKQLTSNVDGIFIKIENINNIINDFEVNSSPADNQAVPRKSISSNNLNKVANQSTNLDSIVNDAAINAVINSEQFRKLSENMRIISNNIGNKANKEEIDALNRNLVSKIEKLADKVNESLKFYDSKLKNIKSGNSDANLSSSNANFDFNFFAQNLENQINDQIKTLSVEIITKQIPTIDLSLNAQVSEMMASIQKHTDELNETYKSIVDIRSCLVSSELLDEIKDLKTRMDSSEEESRRIKYRVTELSKNIEGEEEEENNVMGVVNEQPHASQGATFREKMNILTSTMQTLNDKVAVLEKKANALSREVKDDVKASLKNETAKVIDQFKVKLESFTNKFEHELKNKIDLMGLSSFEHKINNKLYVEMRDKLDKTDLKKNNNIINRKIDSLENKISKTLVDTIIDLQMDEAPLIVKKNMKNVEKCASCNQVLPQSNAMYYSTDKFRTTKYNIKDKLPDIVDNK